MTRVVLASLFISLACICVAGQPLDAQELRGRVVVEGTLGEPVDGAVVTLLSADDGRLDASFTNEQGYFLVRAPTAGEYRIRIDRIGFERWFSPPVPLVAGESRTEEFEVPVRPVRLADIDVSVRRQCFEDPGTEREIEVVFDEARKALEAALLAQRERLFRYSSVMFDRRVTERRLEVWDVETEAAEGLAEAPFRSLEAERLSDEGYIQEEGPTVYYYAPDATVLLSDTFLRDHCFGLDRDEIDGRRFVGLTFEPHDDRALPEISGVLWLDEETAELERVEYRYENIPYEGADDRRIAGEVEYVRLPSGAFIVRDWYIRMPRLAREEGRDDYFIEGFTEYGAELREVTAPEGYPVPWREGGEVFGRAYNTLEDGPLADATLTLDRPDGPDVVRHTGPDGRFHFDGLEPGEYELELRHPIERAIGHRLPPVEFELAEDDRRQISFALPAAEVLFEELCGRSPDGTGVVIGHVRDLETLFPLARAKVWATWTVERESQERGQSYGRKVVESDEVTTDGGGRYVLCGLPAGQDLALQVVAPGNRTMAVSLTVDRPIRVVDFELRPPPP